MVLNNTNKNNSILLEEFASVFMCPRILRTTLVYKKIQPYLHIVNIFIRPSSDGTYYGMVMSVRPSVRVSVRHSFPHFSPTCFDILI